MSYQLYPRSNSEELFQAVLQNGSLASLQPDFAQSRFRPQAQFLFQNNALGEWFKVHLAQEQGISIGLKVSHSKEVLEHYLRLFFPEILPGDENWIHTDIASLLVFQLLKAGPQHRPPALKTLPMQREDLDPQFWSFAQNIAGLFLNYDNYREELSLQAAEDWQRNLWQEVQQGFHWHGQLIGQAIASKRQPQGPVPQLYIIGSGFLNARQLAFYDYLSGFTEVYHFWLTPAEFPPELRDRLFAARSPNNLSESVSKCVGGLPQSLWLENSLHSAALLHSIPHWQASTQQTREPNSLLQLVQQRLRRCTEILPTPKIAVTDGSIQYFACNDRRREVEVLKDQIFAALEANPDWQLNDIAVLAPDINQYQILIENIFQKSDTKLNCNFLDLHFGGTTSGEYFLAFDRLLNLKRFALDECLGLLENPCARASELIRARPDRFWRKIFQHWQLSQGLDEGWHKARNRFLDDYLHDYGTGADLATRMSLDQEDALLLAELLQEFGRLHERLRALRSQLYSISEWVRLFENLQDDFLCCRSQAHKNDRKVLDLTLRNFLAIEESLEKNLLRRKGRGPRFPFTVMYSLLQQKLEQNFRAKGRYLTQGITCASLQPYRSVPFRLLCVLGLNEKDFPRSRPTLRFDLCSSLPQYLSYQAQEQHIFAELLISARERLLLFYQNRDMVRGTERNPSACLHELCYFIARILGQNAEPIWRQLVQVHPQFPFDRRYFEGPFFSYSHSHYRQYLARENPGKPLRPQAICQNVPLEFSCDFHELLAVIDHAPDYFWQHYHGFAEAGTQAELPLQEQFAQGNELLEKGLEPLKYDKWQSQLWQEPEYLLALLRLGPAELRQLLQRETALGPRLLSEEQWQSLRRGLFALQKQIERCDFRPSNSRQYSLLLQGKPFPMRELLSERAGDLHGAFLHPALRLKLEEIDVLLEAHIPRLWIEEQDIFCWNQSPFRFPRELYNLLQQKLLSALYRDGKLLQLEWVYGEGLKE